MNNVGCLVKDHKAKLTFADPCQILKQIQLVKDISSEQNMQFLN